MVEGMHYGWSSSSLPKLMNATATVNTTKEEALAIAQMFTYGSLTSTVASAINFPIINQKLTLVLSIFVMTLSWVLIGTAWTPQLMMVARFFAGVGRFLVYMVSMDYICEIAEPEIRGLLVSLVYIMMNLGLLIIYSIGPHIKVVHCALIGSIISLTELVALKWIPESPYVLISKGKMSKARVVLKSLRKRWNVEDELDKIAIAVRRQENENSKYLDCVTVASNRKALLILSILNAFQVLSGVNISVHNIIKPGGGNSDSYNIARITSITSIASCTLSAFLLDIVGRKPILASSFIVCSITLFIYGLFDSMEENIQTSIVNLNIIPLSCLILYTMVYRMGIGMVPLLMSGELFPMNMKNISSAFCGIISVLVSLLSFEILKYIKYLLGDHYMYWFYSILSFAGCLFTIFCVPETKGLTLEEIQWKLKS